MSSGDRHSRSESGSRAEAGQLAKDFRASMQSLLSRFANRPDELHREMAVLVTHYERALAEIRTAIERRHASRNKHAGDPKRPYVERFRPRPPRPSDRRRPSAGGVLVKPDKPNDLSGGAAAALEFD
jgi:hypothetical protein